LSDDEDNKKHDDLSLEQVMRYQTDKVGKLLDYNQRIVQACRSNALAWREIAQAFARCAEDALEISETCSIAARVAADRAGDLISTEFDLIPNDDSDNDSEEEEDL
jgi:hypothetical protein